MVFIICLQLVNDLDLSRRDVAPVGLMKRVLSRAGECQANKSRGASMKHRRLLKGLMQAA